MTVQLGHSDILDQSLMQEYFQPPVGSTERCVAVCPLRVTDYSIAPHSVIDNYEIFEFGKGFDAVERLVQVVFERQFKVLPNDKTGVWCNAILLKVECELRSFASKELFADIKPNGFADLDPGFERLEGVNRKSDILYYVDRIKNGDFVESSLYVSGNLLNARGASAEPKTLYMLDGARRIVAHALAHSRTVEVYVLIREEELAQLMQSHIKESLAGKIAQIKWFNNYHSLPLLGLTGQRSLHRYDLMDMPLLKGNSVIDFGCNIGQASIRAVQAGAREVLGIDVMDDTLAIAKEIKNILDLRDLDYKRVDFNDPDFDTQIDEYFPGKTDYSFFFSVFRTKELTQRERLFQYVIDKTQKGIFFEGHAHPKIDCIEYYEWLFDSFGLTYKFLGYSEETIRPLFYIDMESK